MPCCWQCLFSYWDYGVPTCRAQRQRWNGRARGHLFGMLLKGICWDACEKSRSKGHSCVRWVSVRGSLAARLPSPGVPWGVQHRFGPKGGLGQRGGWRGGWAGEALALSAGWFPWQET